MSLGLGLLIDRIAPPSADVAPAAPSSLVVTVTGANAVLHWTNNSSNATAIRVESRDGAGSWSTLTTLAANVTTCTDTGIVDASAERSYRVIASNGIGDSLPSNTSVIPPSATISDLAFTWGGDDLLLTFTDPLEYRATAFVVQYNNSGSGGTWATAATESGLSLPGSSNPPPVNAIFQPYAVPFTGLGDGPGAFVRVRVRFTNSGGNGPWSNEYAIPPAVPTGLAITGPTGDHETYHLTWTPGAGATSQRIEMNEDALGWQPYATISDGVTAEWDDVDTFLGPTPSVQRAYRIVSVVGAYESAPSAIVSTIPGTPGSLTLTDLGGLLMDFDFTSAVEAAAESGWVTQFEVRWNNATTLGSYHDLTPIPFGDPTEVLGLDVSGAAANGDNIRLQVRAVNANYQSAWAEIIETVTN